MTAADVRSTGFKAVDDQPDVSMLLSAMDETAQWEATKQLRAWERERLSLRSGQRLLAVGCGLGDAAVALSIGLGDQGELVGIDGSEVMRAEARVRAATRRCRVRFAVGDAGALDEPDASFDAVRTERMLQWVPDPARAVADGARPASGGLVCLTDSDWSNLDFDVGDPDIARRVREPFGVDRGRQTTVDGRLTSLAGRARSLGRDDRHAGLVELGPRRVAPTRRLGADGCHGRGVGGGRPARSDEVDRFVETVEEAARQGRFTMRLTMHPLIAAARPGGD